MRLFMILAIQLVFVSSSFATYINDRGELRREHFSYDKTSLGKEVLKLQGKYTDKFFDEWLLSSLKDKKAQIFMENVFSLFKKKTEIGHNSNKLLGDSDRSLDKVNCYEYNGACNLFKDVGYQRGTMMLYIFSKYGVNTTHHVTEKYEFLQKYNDHQKPFTKEELLAIVIGLDLFGDNIEYFEADKLTMTYADINKGNTTGNALIYFFMKWRSTSLVSKVGTVLHEMYHNLAGSYSEYSGKGLRIDSSDEWMSLHKESRKIVNTNGFDCFVSGYAYTNFAEDAAETLVTYFHNREVLERLCPQKLEFIDEVISRADKLRASKLRRVGRSLGQNLNFLFDSIENALN
ncbi:hypothetical protein A9Q84_14160 [Halobacteriovorax marinus]|uniref:Uncharacterized protein n=1 Tax=Halobacteriovorax marinus TaxID=97084 RepID=A0A1Y5FA61_9BACT|nr:hypothetical protein A9Q84_14160 [Halobacteriovorax marinus]